MTTATVPNVHSGPAETNAEPINLYKLGMLFVINVDEVIQPPQEGLFVEIKSRTWSARDAVRKAHLIGEMLKLFGISSDHIVRQDYADF